MDVFSVSMVQMRIAPDAATNMAAAEAAIRDAAKAGAQVKQAAPPRDGSKVEKRKRKYPYRKSADIEREIAEAEAEVARLEDLLGQPATWRDPVKAVDHQRRHGELKESLAGLYEHWEEAMELNS